VIVAVYVEFAANFPNAVSVSAQETVPVYSLVDVIVVTGVAPDAGAVTPPTAASEIFAGVIVIDSVTGEIPGEE
jgi:hypothetical protein